MLKKILLLAVSTNLLALEQPKTSSMPTILALGATGVGITLAIIAAPYVLPASALLALQASAVTAGPVLKAVTPIASTISASISISRFAAPPLQQYFFPTYEQKFKRLLQEEISEKSFEEQLKEAVTHQSHKD